MLLGERREVYPEIFSFYRCYFSRNVLWMEMSCMSFGSARVTAEQLLRCNYMVIGMPLMRLPMDNLLNFTMSLKLSLSGFLHDIHDIEAPIIDCCCCVARLLFRSERCPTILLPRVSSIWTTIEQANKPSCPYARNDTTVQLRNGAGGGLVLLQDTQLIESLAHFSRERIPERYVSLPCIN